MQSRAQASKYLHVDIRNDKCITIYNLIYDVAVNYCGDDFAIIVIIKALSTDKPVGSYDELYLRSLLWPKQKKIISACSKIKTNTQGCIYFSVWALSIMRHQTWHHLSPSALSKSLPVQILLSKRLPALVKFTRASSTWWMASREEEGGVWRKREWEVVERHFMKQKKERGSQTGIFAM